MFELLLLSLVINTIIPPLDGASYVNRRNMPGEKLLLHRKVTQAPTPLLKCDTITFPEVSDLLSVKLITGIEMMDLQPKQCSSAKVILGGINFPFVTIKISNKLKKGYCYDVKIFGIPNC